MKREMLINAVHTEQKRMAVVEDGKLVEYNIQMAVRDPITGNIYKGVVMKVERGLQAAFVNYGGKRDGFLPLRDVSPDYTNGKENGAPPARSTLKVGQEVMVQVLREVSERKGALLTAYLSLPGRYLVLLPNKQSSGISRKIEDEEDRRRLKDLVEQIKIDEKFGFIVRTAGINRTKQELSRDYQHLIRLWKEIMKRAETSAAPALIYQESDFGVRSLRDYFTSDIEDILVDDVESFRKMRAYCKTVSPRNVKMIILYKDIIPLFEKYGLEDQIRIIYEEKVDLKSGGYIIVNPTEAMITIDVNSGRASNKRNVEETAFKTNIEAAEEIARQLRLRDLGGLIVIDFIDMIDRKHIAEVEKTFKKALSVDRARIQLAHMSKFGILELSRQKKQSTIEEISYNTCPYCKGRGMRPSIEYTALSAYRRIASQAVKGKFSHLKVHLPLEVATYVNNQKRSELQKLESLYDMTIHVLGLAEMGWDELTLDTVQREAHLETVPLVAETAEKHPDREDTDPEDDREEGEETVPPEQASAAVGGDKGAEPPKKKGRRRSRPRHRRRKTVEKADTPSPGEAGERPALDPSGLKPEDIAPRLPTEEADVEDEGSPYSVVIKFP